MKDKTLIDLQETNLRNLLKTGAFQFINERVPWFPYTSGQIGPYYVQSINIEQDGAAYATAIQAMLKIIELKDLSFDAISGGESRDWDFSNPVAVALRKPHIKIYKDGKVLGADIANKTILHITDLNNEGSSLKNHWKPAIERNQGRIIFVLSFVDRLEDGVIVLQSLGLKNLSVVPLDEHAWQIALREGCISQATYQALVDRMRDKHQWAVQALLDHPAHFEALFNNPQTRGKALKIIETYPETSEALGQRVKENTTPS